MVVVLNVPVRRSLVEDKLVEDMLDIEELPKASAVVEGVGTLDVLVKRNEVETVVSGTLDVVEKVPDLCPVNVETPAEVDDVSADTVLVEKMVSVEVVVADTGAIVELLPYPPPLLPPPLEEPPPPLEPPSSEPLMMVVLEPTMTTVVVVSELTIVVPPTERDQVVDEVDDGPSEK